MFETLRKHYRTVHVWAQQAKDVAYLRQLGLGDFAMVDRTVAAYDALLRMEDVDYVGTRLHGGIRALQRGRRTVIIPVDNRATEIAKSTGLPLVHRTDPGAVERWILSPRATVLTMPTEAIARWKRQFAALR